MRDLISREDAIKAMCYACGHECTEEEMQTCPEHYELTHMPSAEPERKKGEWDDIGGVLRYGCQFCHHAQERKSNFCPNCGADMRGDNR